MRNNPENRRAVQEGLHDLEDEQWENLFWDRSKDPEDIMTDAEAGAFLHDSGINLMREFIPNQPLLYVFPDYLQNILHKQGAGACLIARIENPMDLNLEAPGVDNLTKETLHTLRSEGTITVFAIDRKTGTPVQLSSKESHRDYHVRLEKLFVADDLLFPKGAVE